MKCVCKQERFGTIRGLKKPFFKSKAGPGELCMKLMNFQYVMHSSFFTVSVAWLVFAKTVCNACKLSQSR